MRDSNKLKISNKVRNNKIIKCIIHAFIMLCITAIILALIALVFFIMAKAGEYCVAQANEYSNYWPMFIFAVVIITIIALVVEAVCGDF